MARVLGLFKKALSSYAFGTPCFFCMCSKYSYSSRIRTQVGGMRFQNHGQNSVLSFRPGYLLSQVRHNKDGHSRGNRNPGKDRGGTLDVLQSVLLGGWSGLQIVILRALHLPNTHQHRPSSPAAHHVRSGRAFFP